jgi:hypothetical protein
LAKQIFASGASAYDAKSVSALAPLTR